MNKAELGALFAAATILIGCTDSNPHQVITTPTTDTTPNLGADLAPLQIRPEGKSLTPLEVLLLQIKKNQGIDVELVQGRSSPTISDMEVSILASALQKIPAVSYLSPGGIRMEKSGYNANGIGAALVQTQDRGKGHTIEITTASDFKVDAVGGASSALILGTDQEKLEWYITQGFGRLFADKVRERRDQLDPEGDKIDWAGINRPDGDLTDALINPVYRTFASLVDWDNNSRSVTDRLQLTIGWSMYLHSVFADYYAASILRPELLTEQEKNYFTRINLGLRGNPEQFITQISQGPEMLFR